MKNLINWRYKMTFVSEETKKDILELAKSMGLDSDGDFVMYKGKLYLINVIKGIVKPVITHEL